MKISLISLILVYFIAGCASTPGHVKGMAAVKVPSILVCADVESVKRAAISANQIYGSAVTTDSPDSLVMLTPKRGPVVGRMTYKFEPVNNWTRVTLQEEWVENLGATNENIYPINSLRYVAKSTNSLISLSNLFPYRPSDLAANERMKHRSSLEIGSSGPVYVKGYFRKDGTYVRPHSRRR